MAAQEQNDDRRSTIAERAGDTPPVAASPISRDGNG